MNVELPIHPGEQALPAPSVLPIRVKRRGVSWVFQQCLQVLLLGAVALSSYLIVSHFILQSVQVVGMSMAPTLKDSEHYFLNRWIYLVRTPHRGEVVVIKDPADNGFSVKRIVAVPGETLLIKDGHVIVEGKPLAEPYLASNSRTYAEGGKRDQVIRCAEGQYVVLGDNRMHSADSRAYGPVPRANILGLIAR